MTEYKPYVNDETGERLTAAEAETASVDLRHDPYPEGYWNEGAGSNYKGYGNDPGWSETVRVMHAYLGGSVNVLELGCANGWFVTHAAKVFDGVGGIDISEYAINHPAPGINGGPGAEGLIVHGDVVELAAEIPPGQFPVICSWELLEHLTEDQIDKTLAAIVEALPPGGTMWHRIALETEGDPKFEGKPASNAHDDETHLTIEPEAWWREKFAGLGLLRYESAEIALSSAFRDRDWWGRFFVYAKTTIPE